MTEAHNSLEQLNSNWSERNTEQKAQIESMLKDVDELRLQLTQAEKSIETQKQNNEKLKKAFENEVCCVCDDIT